ncbi:hypothetical protein Droror1_Dr00008950 [Drosera rotundifolia]
MKPITHFLSSIFSLCEFDFEFDEIRSASFADAEFDFEIEWQVLDYRTVFSGVPIVGGKAGGMPASKLNGVPSRRVQVREQNHPEDGTFGFGHIGMESVICHSFCLFALLHQ